MCQPPRSKQQKEETPQPPHDPKTRCVDDTNIIKALEEKWDYESTVSPGFERDHAVLQKFPGSHLTVCSSPPKNLYERFALLFIRDIRDLSIFTLALRATLTTLPSALYMMFVWKFSALEQWFPVLLGPLFGQTIYTYYFHHIKMHHVEDNAPGDLSSTLFFQRDNPIHFLYRQLPPLRIPLPRNHLYLATQINFWGTFWALILPFLLSRFGMMSGNWVQHAFLERSDPSFLRRRGEYIKTNAMVLKKTDYDMIWIALMFGRYDWIADSWWVHLDESTPRPSKEQIIAKLKEKTRKFTKEEIDLALAAKQAQKAI
ncbi:hypothetical protein BC829DRAFT_409848 [Chytridium lagenaria]|nr:hypothetical protein BC829DRAFT_409848 [Chytridium lagenaria]